MRIMTTIGVAVLVANASVAVADADTRDASEISMTGVIINAAPATPEPASISIPVVLQRGNGATQTIQLQVTGSIRPGVRSLADGHIFSDVGSLQSYLQSTYCQQQITEATFSGTAANFQWGGDNGALAAAYFTSAVPMLAPAAAQSVEGDYQDIDAVTGAVITDDLSQTVTCP